MSRSPSGRSLLPLRADNGHSLSRYRATAVDPFRDSFLRANGRVWIREEVAPAAAIFGSPVRTIVTGTSYECRGHDRDPGAKVSEHGHANALDVRGLRLANGTAVDFADKSAPKEFRELIRQSSCTAFSTALGPGSDSYHENHIHLDLIERHGGYRLCQWDVLTVPKVPSVPPPPEPPRASSGAK